MFNFVFKMFTEGSASLPENGMGQIAIQISDKLPQSNIKLNTKVTSMLKGEVIAKDLMSNNLFKFECQNIIVATDPEGAKQLFDSSNTFSIPPKRRYK